MVESDSYVHDIYVRMYVCVHMRVHVCACVFSLLFFSDQTHLVINASAIQL